MAFDYSAFCPRYWEGCRQCADYLQDKEFFCRKANMVRFGAARVELAAAGDAEETPRVACAEEMPAGPAKCWWRGRGKKQAAATVQNPRYILGGMGRQNLLMARATAKNSRTNGKDGGRSR